MRMGHGAARSNHDFLDLCHALDTPAGAHHIGFTVAIDDVGAPAMRSRRPATAF